MRKTRDGKPARILITGAGGYIGGRLVNELIDHGYKVKILVRNLSRVKSQPWFNEVEVVVGEADDPNTIKEALRDVSVAYYLLHSLLTPNNFESHEEKLAKTFSAACKKAGVERIVYLGGMVDEKSELSAHLRSRATTGQILRSNGIPTLELRAGVVIGSGSASFEMLRYLTERLPIMTVPRWVNSRIQPIAIRDVLRYLVGAASVPDSVSGEFDIGGPDIFTYREMMDKYAEVAGLRPRIIIPVPVLTPRLSSGWVGLVTPIPYLLARRLVESLKNEVVMGDNRIKSIIPDPPGGLTGFREAVGLALSKVRLSNVDTRWSDASYPKSPSQPIRSDPEWAGGTVYRDVRTGETADSIETVWQRIQSIGGDNGYSTASWAWEIRGLIDRVFGGPGLRRGRRDPVNLVEGDALDFWRVEKIEKGKRLVLRAEMRNPGLAWLDFVLEEDGKGSKVNQTATFVPKGLAGHLYWWLVWPMHGFVFPSMLKKILRG